MRRDKEPYPKNSHFKNPHPFEKLRAVQFKTKTIPPLKKINDHAIQKEHNSLPLKNQ